MQEGGGGSASPRDSTRRAADPIDGLACADGRHHTESRMSVNAEISILNLH